MKYIPSIIALVLSLTALTINLSKPNHKPATVYGTIDVPLSFPPFAYGRTDPRVTQENIQTTICKAGYTATVRPSSSYTSALERKQLQADFSLIDKDPSHYEEDHIISLELGGAPKDEMNLYPQPYAGVYGAHEKDQVENYLHKHVCDGTLPLASAQRIIKLHWQLMYQFISSQSK